MSLIRMVLGEKGPGAQRREICGYPCSEEINTVLFSKGLRSRGMEGGNKKTAGPPLLIQGQCLAGKISMFSKMVFTAQRKWGLN